MEKEQSLSKELDEIKLKVKALSLPNRVATDESEFGENMERGIVVENDLKVNAEARKARMLEINSVKFLWHASQLCAIY